MGFVPEIDRLLKKYNLSFYLTTYMNSGVFPSKTEWKSILRLSVTSFAESAWYDRVISNTNLRDFLQIKPVLQYPTEFLYLSRSHSRFKKSCDLFLMSVCKLFSDTFTNKCPKCLLDIDSIVQHIFRSCRYTLQSRIDIYHHTLLLYGRQVFTQFIKMQPRIRTITVLMCFRNMVNDDAKALIFHDRCYRFLAGIVHCFSVDN